MDLADGAGLLVRLMGGMAIRAHAPDWPARTRRVEVDLDFATRRTVARSTSSWPPRGTRPTSGTTPCSGQAGLLRRRAPPPAGRRARRQPRDVPPLRVQRSARSVEPDAAPRRAAPVEAPGRQDQPQGRPRRAGPARRAPARPGRRRPRCAARAGRHQRPADPVVHLERLGLVADGDRQPRHARPVPRGRADTRGSRSQQRPGGPVRPGRPDRGLRTAIEDAPKSTSWKLRARVGDRQPWYQEPEEMGHD